MTDQLYDKGDISLVRSRHGEKSLEYFMMDMLEMREREVESLASSLAWCINYGDLSVSEDNPLHRTSHLDALTRLEMNGYHRNKSGHWEKDDD